jgi:histidinol dehydrogenase
MRVCSVADFQRELTERRESCLEQHEQVVREIISAVRQRGDQAVAELTARFDGADLAADQLLVSRSEVAQAYDLVDDRLRSALAAAGSRIRRYHQRQLRSAWMETGDDGSILGQRFTPLQRVGLYVPGGTAAYPSSVLMSAIPAQVAGVPELVISTPPGPDGRINPAVLVAADQLGIDTVYKAGGAQAIAAMAFGTELLRPVDKLVGPGNIYVTVAKRQVFGYVDIDMLAGPSEILILADGGADPSYLAADLLSQAEHDQLAQAVLVTPDRELAQSVQVELSRQLERLPRRSVAEASIQRNGRIVLVKDLWEGAAIANQFAPEHLELLVAEPWALLGRIQHAGAIFLGPWSPEPIGDYVAGPSHVLPTGGTARFASGLSVDSFRKSSSIIALSEPGFLRIAEDARYLAETEGLAAHAWAVQVRGERRERANRYSEPINGGYH